MPPLYEWQSESTGKKVSIVRPVNEIEKEPSGDETQGDPGPWKRLMCASTFKRGPNWTGSKGNW
jgi:hypothetical protein